MNLKGPMMVNNFRKHLNTYPKHQEEIRAYVWEWWSKKPQEKLIDRYYRLIIVNHTDHHIRESYRGGNRGGSIEQTKRLG